MARGRFISDSVATDARLNSLSVEAELAYLMTIPHLDRDGLIDGDPFVLWGRVCPKRRQFLDLMAVYIQEWAAAGLVIMYDTEEGPVLWFRGFAKNQVGLRYDRETPSKFPPPPGCTRNSTGMIPNPPQEAESPPAEEVRNDAQSSAEEVRQESGNSPAQWQVEVKVQDQVQDQAQAATAAPPAPACDVLGPKALIEDLRGRRFMYLDPNANLLAAAILDDFSWDRVMAACDIAEKRHREKAKGGQRGIMSPLAYVRTILEGNEQSNGDNNGNNQARGGQADRGDIVELDPELQRRMDEHRAKRKAEGSAFYG